MKRGAIYIVRDLRTNPRRRCTPIVKVHIALDGRLQLSCTPGNGKLWLPLLDEHPDFSDDEEEGIVRVPTSEGIIVLLWPTAERYAELETQLPDDDWPELTDEATIQTALHARFLDLL